MTVSTVLTDMNPRLAAAAAAVTSAREALAAEIEIRDRLVVAAVDGGMGQRAVARAARISIARVVAILASSQPDDD